MNCSKCGGQNATEFHEARCPDITERLLNIDRQADLIRSKQPEKTLAVSIAWRLANTQGTWPAILAVDGSDGSSFDHEALFAVWVNAIDSELRANR